MTAPMTRLRPAPPMRIDTAPLPARVVVGAAAVEALSAVPLSCSATSWNAVKLRAPDSSLLMAL
jgi:hypothetical protein